MNRDCRITRDEGTNDLEEKYAELDDPCREIFVTLLAYKRLRFNQLLATLRKFGMPITQPTLKDHLDHLLEKGFVDCKRGFQSASYGLTENIGTLMEVSQEDLKNWFEARENSENVPDYLKPLKLSGKELYERFSDELLDEIATNDLSDSLGLSLFELKTFIDYDLRMDRFKSNADFWKFVGNPIYRMHEKSIAERCRDSEKYRKLLFEKIDLLIDHLRSDRELLRKRTDEARR
jgi:DNA-binding HxlR family transcriptional regulator